MNGINEAARDLWGQIFERAAAQPDATIWDPTSDDDDGERFRQAMKGAGWDDQEITARFEYLQTLEPPAVATSPGVAPFLEPHANRIAERISAALAAKGVAHQPVLVGIDPRAGVEAGLTNVIMTQEAVLTVTSFFFRWCGLIARAYTRTLQLDPYYWSEAETSPAADRLLLLRNIDLVLYWNRIFVSFASTGTHALVPYRPATPKELTLFEQVAWSLEYFAFSHEYGHHVLAHRGPDDDPIEQEHAADRFAMNIADELIDEPFRLVDNPYIANGAGAVLLLMANDTLRWARENDVREAGERRTHPQTSDRISRIANRHVMQPVRLKVDRDFCDTVARIMTAVDGVVREFYERGGQGVVHNIQTSIREATTNYSAPAL